MSALALQSFGFEGQTVRVMDRLGMPWFVAQDVCGCLEIANPRDAVARLDEDEKGVGITDTLGGIQEVSIISESGVYALVFRSRKPAALRFRKWVTSEVLPALRQTGRYEIIPANDGLGDLPIDVRDEPNVARACVAVVRLCMRLHGKAAARQMWKRVGLPPVDDNQPLPMLMLSAEADPIVREWVDERCDIGSGFRMPSTELFDDFCNWIADQGKEPWSMQSFGRQLTRLGFIPKHSGRIWRLNIRLKD